MNVYYGGTRYAGVKRRAGVGEQILITDAYLPSGLYEDGDVLTVNRTDDDHVTVRFGAFEKVVLHEEYVTLAEAGEDTTDEFDDVEKPLRYHQGGIDVIGFSEAKFDESELKGFHRINVLKYVTRYDQKGGKKDLEKAMFYLRKLIELEEDE